MKPLLTTLLIFSISIGFAQKKIIGTSFLKNNGTYVTVRDSADYYRIVTEPDSGSALFNVAEYYKNGTKRLIGKSKNSEHPLFEGPCETFYKSGGRYCTCTYRDGARVGDEYFFFPNGKTYLVLTFPADNNRYNEGKDVSLIKANYDSLGTALVENGNGYCKSLDETFKEVVEEGNIKNGKHDGLWKGYYKKTKLGFTENYKDGELISGTATFGDGSSATYTKTRGLPPEFKGGLEAFSKYLGKNISYPKIDRENNIHGTVVLSFVVEKDGKLTDVKVFRSVSPTIDAEAVRVIEKCPPWVPGTQFGRPVRVSYSVPVNFSLTGN